MSGPIRSQDEIARHRRKRRNESLPTPILSPPPLPTRLRESRGALERPGLGLPEASDGQSQTTAKPLPASVPPPTTMSAGRIAEPVALATPTDCQNAPGLDSHLSEDKIPYTDFSDRPYAAQPATGAVGEGGGGGDGPALNEANVAAAERRVAERWAAERRAGERRAAQSSSDEHRPAERRVAKAPVVPQVPGGEPAVYPAAVHVPDTAAVNPSGPDPAVLANDFADARVKECPKKPDGNETKRTKQGTAGQIRVLNEIIAGDYNITLRRGRSKYTVTGHPATVSRVGADMKREIKRICIPFPPDELEKVRGDDIGKLVLHIGILTVPRSDYTAHSVRLEAMAENGHSFTFGIRNLPPGCSRDWEGFTGWCRYTNQVAEGRAFPVPNK